MSAPLKLFLIAGEPSGDRLGAALMRGLRAESGRRFEFFGVGGAAMAAAGLDSLFPMQEISVMGIAEVLPRLRSILRRIDETANQVERLAPDALITIDAPAFSLRVAKRARRTLGGRTKFIHYVAPSVWAWRPKRAGRMARHVDHLLALLPFEPPYFHRVGLSCDFVGHPAIEAFDADGEPPPRAALRAEFDLPDAAPAVAVLPGSRRGEVERLAAVFRESLARLRERRPDLVVLVPAAEPVAGLVAEKIADWPFPTRLIDPRGLAFEAAERRKRMAMRAADAALAASGTVSLELAAARTPMVVAYRMNPLTSAIAERLLTVPSVVLMNLIVGENVAPEYLQRYCTPEALTTALDRLLDPDDAGRARQLVAAEETMRQLGEGDAPPSRRAARSVLAQLG